MWLYGPHFFQPRHIIGLTKNALVDVHWTGAYAKSKQVLMRLGLAGECSHIWMDGGHTLDKGARLPSFIAILRR